MMEKKEIDLDKLKCPICGKKMIIKRIVIERDMFRNMIGEPVPGIAYTLFDAECDCGLELTFKSPNYMIKWREE